jgi:hypothetical protein
MLSRIILSPGDRRLDFPLYIVIVELEAQWSCTASCEKHQLGKQTQ